MPWPSRRRAPPSERWRRPSSWGWNDGRATCSRSPSGSATGRSRSSGRRRVGSAPRTVQRTRSATLFRPRSRSRCWRPWTGCSGRSIGVTRRPGASRSEDARDQALRSCAIGLVAGVSAREPGFLPGGLEVENRHERDVQDERNRRSPNDRPAEAGEGETAVQRVTHSSVEAGLHELAAGPRLRQARERPSARQLERGRYDDGDTKDHQEPARQRAGETELNAPRVDARRLANEEQHHQLDRKPALATRAEAWQSGHGATLALAAQTIPSSAAVNASSMNWDGAAGS